MRALAIVIAFLPASWAGAMPRPAISPPLPARVDFNRDIRPVFSTKCFACHGSDAAARMANLRLDRRDQAIRDRGGYRAITPGHPERSRLYQRIAASDPARRMPPPGSGRTLTARDVQLLRRWIAQGAPYAEHWAWLKPKQAPLPSVKQIGWVRNPVDRFILSRLEKEGLHPSPEADRYTLIRRLSLDLIGLPPSPAEVTAFVSDRSPDAYEKLVDRLLASPHYGERWARVWLDLARYADSAGYGSDPLRPNLWPYRDWVISAFNRNLPYDQFTIEQLAGDLLPHPSQEQLIATAFHRNTMTNTEGGTDPEEYRVAAIKDRAATTAQVWMGLTMGCAQCHSHKFDPITQREYYQFVAFFNQTEDANRGDEAPTLPLPTPAQQVQKERLEPEIQALQLQVITESPPLVSPLYLELARKEKELAATKPVELPIMRELPLEKRRVTHLLHKGNFLDPGEVVAAGPPASFPPLPPGTPRNRLGLARWLVSRENPLTARVAVNRFWAQLFGTGIVETEEDFGTQGALPSHPELLDWLAVDFMRHDWDMKRLVKTIVISAAYRQLSRVTPELLRKDPRNRLLSRYPRRRLEAEGVRDQALAISGLLSPKIGGPSVFPPQPDGLWQAAFNGERTWPTSTGEDRYRRGLYTFWRRTVPYPSMATFDAPSREICTMRRVPTNTPLQALVTLNDPAYVEMAQALARRILREGGVTTADRARCALRLALVRPPQEAQVAALIALYDRELAGYRSDPTAALKLASAPLGPLPEGMDVGQAAAWTVAANVLLNLDGVLTKG